MDKGEHPEPPSRNEHETFMEYFQRTMPSPSPLPLLPWDEELAEDSGNQESQEQLPSNEGEAEAIAGESTTLDSAPLASTLFPKSEEPLSEDRESLGQSMALKSAPLASTLVPQSEDREPLRQSMALESAPLPCTSTLLPQSESEQPISKDREPFQNPQNGTQTHSNGYHSQMALLSLKAGESGLELVFKPEKGIQFEFLMPVVQKGNQRCTGPPYGHTGPPPSEECEVYGGLLPRDVYEDRIFGVFRRYGTIFGIRILTKPDGSSQGYFNVHYYRKEAAELAVSELNGFKFLGESTDKSGIRLKQLTQINRLFISGIPNGFTNRHVYKALHGTKCGIGLTGVDVPQEMGYLNRGYCFLEYKDHKSALKAGHWIRNLKPFKANVVINWAIPQAPKVEDPENIGTYLYSNAHWIQEVPRGTIPIAPQRPSPST